MIQELKLFVEPDGDTYVVATDPHDAHEEWCKFLGERVTDYTEEAWIEVPSDKLLRFRDEDDDTVYSKTAADWVESHGRGFLATGEW